MALTLQEISGAIMLGKISMGIGLEIPLSHILTMAASPWMEISLPYSFRTVSQMLTEMELVMVWIIFLWNSIPISATRSGQLLIITAPYVVMISWTIMRNVMMAILMMGTVAQAHARMKLPAAMGS